MTFLLDTNVLSELRKPARRADPGVRAWTSAQVATDLHLSVVTILEIELGIARVARRDRAQGATLTGWLENEVLKIFAGRIVEVDVRVARRAARLHVPDPRPERDALIAATALVHDLVVVTRNVSDFGPTGVETLDPWSSGVGA